VEPSLAFLLTPVVLGAVLIWNFAVLSAVQLTVRLIGAYSPRQTAVAAVLLTLASIPIAALLLFAADASANQQTLEALRARGLAFAQAYAFQQRLAWFPLAIALTTVAGFVIIRARLRFKRTRSALAAALGIGLLSAPWVMFLHLPT
jgi:hypothetical protein